VELKFRKTRVEDALSATRAAVEEGYVAGGGVALLNATEALDTVRLAGDAATGVHILRRALEEPLRTIAANAGQDGAVIVDRVRRAQREQHDPHLGYNVLDGRVEDLVEAGVIDAAKVTRSALENAASIAALILTTEVLITDLPEQAPAPAMPDY
jgi:chaperonin GroEL